jgi:hypothetical protein
MTFNMNQELLLTRVPLSAICNCCDFIGDSSDVLYCLIGEECDRVSLLEECPIGLWTRYNSCDEYGLWTQKIPPVGGPNV